MDLIACLGATWRKLTLHMEADLEKVGKISFIKNDYVFMYIYLFI